MRCTFITPDQFDVQDSKRSFSREEGSDTGGNLRHNAVEEASDCSSAGSQSDGAAKADEGSDSVWNEIDAINAQLDDLPALVNGKIQAAVEDMKQLVTAAVRELVPAMLEDTNAPIMSTLDLLISKVAASQPTAQAEELSSTVASLQSRVGELDALIRGHGVFSSASALSPSASISRPPRGGTVDRVCKYGRRCHRHDCVFAHPEGRLIEEASAATRTASVPRGRRAPRGDTSAAARHASDGPDRLDYGKFEDIVAADELEEFLTAQQSSLYSRSLAGAPPEPDVD